MVRKIASQTGWWREHGPLLSQKWSHLSFGPGKHNHLSFGWHTHITPLAYPQPSCPKKVSKKPKKCHATIVQIILSLHLSMGKQHNARNSFRPLMISRFARLWLVVRSKSHLACDQQSPCFLSHASLQLFLSQQGEKYYDKYFVPRFFTTICEPAWGQILWQISRGQMLWKMSSGQISCHMPLYSYLGPKLLEVLSRRQVLWAAQPRHLCRKLLKR